MPGRFSEWVELKEDLEDIRLAEEALAEYKRTGVSYPMEEVHLKKPTPKAASALFEQRKCTGLNTRARAGVGFVPWRRMCVTASKERSIPFASPSATSGRTISSAYPDALEWCSQRQGR